MRRPLCETLRCTAAQCTVPHPAPAAAAPASRAALCACPRSATSASAQRALRPAARRRHRARIQRGSMMCECMAGTAHGDIWAHNAGAPESGPSDQGIDPGHEARRRSCTSTPQSCLSSEANRVDLQLQTELYARALWIGDQAQVEPLSVLVHLLTAGYHWYRHLRSSWV